MIRLSGVLLLSIAAALPLAASRSQGFDVPYENFPYNGQFTFAGAGMVSVL